MNSETIIDCSAGDFKARLIEALRSGNRRAHALVVISISPRVIRVMPPTLAFRYYGLRDIVGVYDVFKPNFSTNRLQADIKSTCA